MATAAPAWSRSRASACSRRHAAAIPPTAWRSPPTAPGRSTSQKMVLELLLSDVPETSYTLDSELDHWARRLSVGKPRFAARHQPAEDLSHPAIAVNLDACIQCGRCVRACREEQVNDVIGYAFRGVALEDRVRPRRSDGRIHLRRLRRMRPGVSDRRAHARARGREDRGRQAGGVGVPVLRRRAASSPTTSRTTRFSSCRARTARRTRAGCASRAATASTTCSTSIASPGR